MKKVGDIVKDGDNYYEVIEVNPDNPNQYDIDMSKPISMEDSGAGFIDRAQAGLASDADSAQLKAWRNIKGADNVRQADDGSIFVLDNGRWKPTDEQGFGLGDIADYSGDAIEDLGAGIGGVIGGATGGIGAMNPLAVPVGIGIGGGIGKGIGSAVRQGAANLAGVRDDISAGETLGAIGEGAIVEPLSYVGGKAIAAGARKVAPYVKEAAAKLPRGITNVIGSGATGTNYGAIGELISDKGDEVLAMWRDSQEYLLNAVDEAVKLPQFFVDKAQDRYVAELGEGGIDMTVPAMKGGLVDAITDIHKKAKIFDSEGGVRELARLGKKSEIDEIVDFWPSKVNAIQTVDDAADLKILLNQRLEKSFDNPLSGQLEKHLKQLLGETDNVIKQAAESQGKLDAWKSAKAAYGDRMDAAKKAKRYFGDPDKALSTIRLQKGQSKITKARDIDKMLKLEPELSYLSDIFDNADTVSKLNVDIPALGSSRDFVNITDDLSAPQKAMAMVARHPKFGYPAIVRAGKVGRGIGEAIETGVEAIGGNAAIPREAIKETARAGIGQVFEPAQRLIGEPTPTLADITPDIVEFARTRYGANYKRAIESGMEPDQAALSVARKLIQDGKARAVADGVGITQNETMMIMEGAGQ